MFNKILKLSVMLVALVSFMGAGASAYAGVLDAEYVGVIEEDDVLQRNTAITSDEKLSRSLSNKMGVEFYCMVKDTIEGDFGLTIGFLVALYGLFLFILKGESFGILVMLAGVAFTFVPSLVESTVSGMSKLSHSKVKADNWIISECTDQDKNFVVPEKPSAEQGNPATGSGSGTILQVQPPLFVNGWMQELGLPTK